MRLGARCPRVQPQLAQPRQLFRVSDLDDLAADQHAPAGVRRGVGPIDLERDPAAPARGVEFGSLVGAEHHHVAVEDVVDRKHHWPAVIDDSHPPQMLPGQQFEALGLRQLLPAGEAGYIAHTASTPQHRAEVQVRRSACLGTLARWVRRPGYRLSCRTFGMTGQGLWPLPRRASDEWTNGMSGTAFGSDHVLLGISLDAARARLERLAGDGALLGASEYAYGEGIACLAEEAGPQQGCPGWPTCGPEILRKHGTVPGFSCAGGDRSRRCRVPGPGFRPDTFPGL